MAKILTTLLLQWGEDALLDYSCLSQQIFSKIFCATLDLCCWHIEGRAQYYTRYQLIIDHLVEPHHHPHIWRTFHYGVPIAWLECNIGDQLLEKT